MDWRGGTSDANSARFSPDGSRLVTTVDDQTARIWDASRSTELYVHEGRSDWVRSAVFGTDASQVATGSDDNTVRIWVAASGEQAFLLLGHTDWARSASFSPDGAWFALGSDDHAVRIWDPATGDLLSVLEGHSGWVMNVSFDLRGPRILSRDKSGAAWLWDAVAGVHIASFEMGGTSGRTAPATRADSEPRRDGDDGAAAQEDSRAQSSGIHDFRVATSINFAGFSLDGQRVLTASNDKAARVWDARTGDAVLTLRGHRGAVRYASMSPDNTRIATASGDGTARIWNAETGEELLRIEHDSAVQIAIFSEDGMRLVTNDNSGNAFSFGMLRPTAWKNCPAIHQRAGKNDTRFGSGRNSILGCYHDRQPKGR